MHVDTIYEPKQVIEAQVSLRFSLAIRVLKRSNDLRLYMDPRVWRDPEVLEMERKIHFYIDPAAKDGEHKFLCNMKVTLLDGRVLEGSVPYHKGTPKNPLSREEVQQKFLSLGDGILPKSTLESILDKVENLDREEDISKLNRLMISAKG